jgi:hypothetical protein
MKSNRIYSGFHTTSINYRVRCGNLFLDLKNASIILLIHVVYRGEKKKKHCNPRRTKLITSEWPPSRVTCNRTTFSYRERIVNFTKKKKIKKNI